MADYYDLEFTILSCLLLEPDLMKQLKLQDKHFTKHQRIWQFMKSFYAKFGTFDVVLMFNVCKDKTMLVEHLKHLVNAGELALPCNFEMYQKQLFEEFEQKKQNRWITNEIFKISNELYVGNIDLETFENKLNEIKKNAKIIFKKGE